MMLRSGLDLRRAFRAWALGTGFAVLLAAAPARAQNAAPPAPAMPWSQIDAGLAQLAGGDGKAAEASFEKARSDDGSGLAALLMDLTEAYLAYHRPSAPGIVAPVVRTWQWLDNANRHYHQRPVPQAVLGDTLTRIRRILKQMPPSGSPSLLRPLLCNLRLLSGDRATDGEPVLEGSGQSHDFSGLALPQGVFTPSPPFPETARKDRITGVQVVEVTVDSEGCPASAKFLKSLPDRLDEQTLASLRWQAYEPARYQGAAVAVKFTLSLRFMIA